MLFEKYQYFVEKNGAFGRWGGEGLHFEKSLQREPKLPQTQKMGFEKIFYFAEGRSPRKESHDGNGLNRNDQGVLAI